MNKKELLITFIILTITVVVTVNYGLNVYQGKLSLSLPGFVGFIVSGSQTLLTLLLGIVQGTIQGFLTVILSFFGLISGIYLKMKGTANTLKQQKANIQEELTDSQVKMSKEIRDLTDERDDLKAEVEQFKNQDYPNMLAQAHEENGKLVMQNNNMATQIATYNQTGILPRVQQLEAILQANNIPVPSPTDLKTVTVVK